MNHSVTSDWLGNHEVHQFRADHGGPVGGYFGLTIYDAHRVDVIDREGQLVVMVGLPSEGARYLANNILQTLERDAE